MSIRASRRAAILIVLATLVVPGAADARTQRAGVSGRVRVTALPSDAASTDSVQARLEAALAPSPGEPFARRRLLSIQPRQDGSGAFDILVYDYDAEEAYEAVVDAQGNQSSRRAVALRPPPAANELDDAMALVNQSPEWAGDIASEALHLYEPMPPVSVDPSGRRLVNVGIMSPASAGSPLDYNEIVSVDLGSDSIHRYTEGAPETSRAQFFSCGPARNSCSASSSASCASYHIEWPLPNPVWKLDIRHPSCTQSGTIGQSDGTGLEIANVYFNDRLVLQNAQMPVVNVFYAGDACGPFRDWLFTENCFQAVGTDVPTSGSGVRVTTGNPAPSTICSTGDDTGNFKGVAIDDLGDTLVLLTEMNAGWYHYTMQWRLHLGGAIEPQFGITATSNNCTCIQHRHHGYWRLEWALDGTSGSPGTGVATLERRRPGTTDQYDPVPVEATFARPTTHPELDWWRIQRPQTGMTYLLEPGAQDRTLADDALAQWDLAALAYNPGQINDPNFPEEARISIDPWLNSEALGASKRLVTWYHFSAAHSDPGGLGEACELLGPKLVPVLPCMGSLALEREGATCSDSLALTVEDSDLVNAGTIAVAVFSGAEPATETVTLAETPAGSGHFAGTITTTAAAPVHADGRISVASGDTIHVRYLDASQCGIANVACEKTVTVDCTPPVLSGVQAVGITENSATIIWSTDGSATSVLHSGTAPPCNAGIEGLGISSIHGVTLTGLSECTTYYYWVESADALGNVAASNSGGGYFAFTTLGRVHPPAYTSSDGPVAIPDNEPAGATSSIVVSDTRTVLDANVTVNLSHTRDEDLVLALMTPANATIPLFNHRGGTGADLTATVFDDQAATPIAEGSAPFTGRFQPEAPLAPAAGASAAGTWRLRLQDDVAGESGTLENWSLSLTYPAQTCSQPSGPPPAPDGVVGASMTASRLALDGSSLHLAWDVVSCPAKNYHLLYGPLAGVPAYEIAGGVCGVGPLGLFDWTSTPGGNLWFVLVGDDAVQTESTWGKDSAGADRGGIAASGQCGFTQRTNAATCP